MAPHMEGNGRPPGASVWKVNLMSHDGKLDQDGLQAVLKNHHQWMLSGGTEGERADLRGQSLVGLALWRCDLRRALLDECDLSGANLDHADLRQASLRGARLEGASLWEAKLAEASLAGAVLRDAKLDHADLRGADLSGADMRNVSLERALLDGAGPPVDLDARRGMAAQRDTEDRRHSAEVQEDEAARRLRQDDLADAMASAPSEDWPDVAEKARYLITVFSATPEGRDPRYQRLIASVLADMRRLSARS